MARHLRVLLPLLAIAGSAFAAGGTVYKWKDAAGGLHFTDTPPPAGATLIRGPAGATPTPAERTQALETLERDAAGLSAGTPADDAAARKAAEAQAAAAIARECMELRITREALERMRTGQSTERLTDEERAALPGSIAETDARIASLCP